MSQSRPCFLISIDTEGDNVWSRPRHVTTENARTLPRFQQLCERFGFRPTYLVNFEMANDAAFRAFGFDVLARKSAEIGMHMHPWDSPPIIPLGERDWYDQPHPLEYPGDVLDRKVVHMTRVLEDMFSITPTSHRAGRWGFNSAYAQSLIRLGYRVDCSVTPHVSWQSHPGHPGGPGGADFTHFPDRPYYLDPDDIGRAGQSPLLEIPMTTMIRPRPLWKEVARRALGRRNPRVAWLRPNGRNLAEMIDVVDTATAEQRDYIQFTLHSSEFMPGGSPAFPDGPSIETLYSHMEEVFAHIARSFRGATLSEYADRFAATHA